MLRKELPRSSQEHLHGFPPSLHRPQLVAPIPRRAPMQPPLRLRRSRPHDEIFQSHTHAAGHASKGGWMREPLRGVAVIRLGAVRAIERNVARLKVILRNTEKPATLRTCPPQKIEQQVIAVRASHLMIVWKSVPNSTHGSIKMPRRQRMTKHDRRSTSDT